MMPLNILYMTAWVIENENPEKETSISASWLYILSIVAVYICVWHDSETAAGTDGDLIRMVQQQSPEAYYQQSQEACGGFLMLQKQMLI